MILIDHFLVIHIHFTGADLVVAHQSGKFLQLLTVNYYQSFPES